MTIALVSHRLSSSARSGEQHQVQTKRKTTGIHPIDLLRSCSVVCRKIGHPLPQGEPDSSHRWARRSINCQASPIAAKFARRLRYSAAVVGGNQRARATDMPSVVETKVAWHAAKITQSAPRGASWRYDVSPSDARVMVPRRATRRPQLRLTCSLVSRPLMVVGSQALAASRCLTCRRDPTHALRRYRIR